MSIKQNALTALAEYIDAHESWNKVQSEHLAKEKRLKHKQLIEAGKLYRPQHKPESER